MSLKTYTLLAGALFALSACSNNGKTPSETVVLEESNVENIKEVTLPSSGSKTYSGVLPAADAPGIQYTVTLNFDGAGDNDGSYSMTTQSLGTDSLTETINGNFVVNTSTNNSSKTKYIKLTPGHTDRGSDLESASADVVYFLLDSDSTITMTNAELDTPASGLNYTLTAQ